MAVALSPETKIFTVYGGVVPPERLVVEQSIEVWFSPESLASGSSPPVAAVVRVQVRQ
jgi:hypothetical protein